MIGMQTTLAGCSLSFGRRAHWNRRHNLLEAKRSEFTVACRWLLHAHAHGHRADSVTRAPTLWHISSYAMHFADGKRYISLSSTDIGDGDDDFDSFVTAYNIYTCMESHFLHNNKTNKLSYGFGYSWDVRGKHKSQQRAQKQSQTNGNNKNRMATKEIKRRKTRAHQRNSGKTEATATATAPTSTKRKNWMEIRRTIDVTNLQPIYGFAARVYFSCFRSSLARSHFFAFFSRSLFYYNSFTLSGWRIISFSVLRIGAMHIHTIEAEKKTNHRHRQSSAAKSASDSIHSVDFCRFHRKHLLLVRAPRRRCCYFYFSLFFYLSAE